MSPRLHIPTHLHPIYNHARPVNYFPSALPSPFLYLLFSPSFRRPPRPTTSSPTSLPCLRETFHLAACHHHTAPCPLPGASLPYAPRPCPALLLHIISLPNVARLPHLASYLLLFLSLPLFYSLCYCLLLHFPYFLLVICISFLCISADADVVYTLLALFYFLFLSFFHLFLIPNKCFPCYYLLHPSRSCFVILS